jgi:hypothetical protein
MRIYAYCYRNEATIKPEASPKRGHGVKGINIEKSTETRAAVKCDDEEEDEICGGHE